MPGPWISMEWEAWPSSVIVNVYVPGLKLVVGRENAYSVAFTSTAGAWPSPPDEPPDAADEAAAVEPAAAVPPPLLLPQPASTTAAAIPTTAAVPPARI